MYLNPASIADSRAKFSIDLGSFNFGMDNNLGTISLSGFVAALGSNNTSISSAFTSYSGNANFSLLLPYADIHLPGVMVSIDDKNSIAINLRVRAFNQFNNFSQNIFRTVLDSSFSPNQDYMLSSKNFNWTIQSWAEVNATYARVLYNNDAHMLKAGVTLKYLIGIAYVGIKGNNLDANYYHTNDSLSVQNTDIEYATNLPVDSVGNDLSSLIKQVTGNAGHGFGADIGIIYEYRPNFKDYIVDAKNDISDPSVNKYKIKLAVSLTDLGSINYNNSNTGMLSGNGNLSKGKLINDFTSITSLRDYASANGFNFDTGVSSVKVHLPSALVSSIDYNIVSSIYINATYIANIANRQEFGNSYYNQITITPRYDTKFFSLGVPITYSSLSESVKAGFGLRMGGFFMGTDDVLAFVSNTTTGVNFYLGAYVPIGKKPVKHQSASSDADRPSISK